MSTSLPVVKVNLGCGFHILKGWRNHDNGSHIPDSPEFFRTDIRKTLPYNDNTVQFILAEHILEHLTFREAIDFLAECKRILRPGGIIRIAVPALDRIMKLDGAYEAFLSLMLVPPPKNRKETVHTVLASWGHQSAYTTESLKIVLWSCGFLDIKDREYGKSDHIELQEIDGHATTHEVLEIYPEFVDTLKLECAIFEASK